MKNFFQALIASIMVAVPLAFIYITISTGIAIANISGAPVTIVSESFLDIFKYPGFWVFYVRSVKWIFFGCLLASGLTLFMTSMKRCPDQASSHRLISQALIASIVVAVPLTFTSMTINSVTIVSESFLDILAYPESWIFLVTDILLSFLGCFLASALTLFMVRGK